MAIILISSIAFTSCQQEPGQQPLQNIIPTLDQYLNDPIQNFTIDGNFGGKIIGNKGTVIVFPPDAFLDPISNQIITGEVYIQLVEVYSKSDMIKNNQCTNTGCKPFTSLGQIMVKAFKNGQELAANHYYHIYFPYSGGHSWGVQPWIGSSSYWFDGSGFFEMLPSYDSSFVGGTKCFLPKVINPNGENSYRASMNCLGWLGCGTWEMQSGNDAVYATFQIDSTLNINEPNTITRLFIVHHDYNSVTKLDYYPSFFNTEPYQFYAFDEIPFESNISILVLHANSQQFYMAESSISSMPGDTTLYIPMYETSLPNIKTTIESFD